MATITTRAGKGSPLTNTELDSNFTNLNTDKLETSGGSMTGDLSFGDNDKAIFGAGSDLQIYHDGSKSIINDAGTGNLEMQVGGSTKLATTSTGIDVTGTVTADGLTVDDGTVLIRSDNAGNLSTPTIRFLDTDTSQAAGQKAGQVEFYTSDSSPGPAGVYAYVNAQAENTNGLGALYFGTGLSGSAANRLSIGSGGDISFYEDTGTTAKLFWDASAERLGIGTATPATNLDISQFGGTPTIRISNVDGTFSAGQDIGKFEFYCGDQSNPGERVAAYILSQAAGVNGGGDLQFATSANAGTVTERARIDTSGNLLVGTTNASGASAPDNSATAGDAGIRLSPSGFIGLGANEAPSGYFNRIGTDGEIVRFRKDGTTVGSIVTYAGDLIIGDDDIAIRFDTGAGLIPWDIGATATGGSARDAAIDIGASSARFKDLYLSGGVYLGGTGAANHLDDYEEGTWTPVLDTFNGDATFTYSQQHGHYTKVGRLVTVTFWVSATATSIGTGTDCVIEGLPFAQSTSSVSRHGSAALGRASGFVTTQPTGVYYVENATTAMFLTGITPSNFNTVSGMSLYGQFYFYQA